MRGWKPEECGAERLRDGAWIVRPRGAVGTCGFYPRAWSAVCVRAPSAAQAIRKACRGVRR